MTLERRKSCQIERDEKIDRTLGGIALTKISPYKCDSEDSLTHRDMRPGFSSRAPAARLAIRIEHFLRAAIDNDNTRRAYGYA
jgi:hypothetical protein